MNFENQNDHNLQLWKAAQKGDRHAFDELYKKNVQFIFQYGINLGLTREFIKDHIQDLFTDLWRKRQQLQIDKSFKNYLLLSFRRLAFRKKKQIITIDLDEENLDHPTEFPKEFSEPSSNPKEKSNKLKEALQYLPKRQREAIFLKYFENLDYEEIANTMEIQVPAVYKLVSVGIKKLRTIL